MKFVQPLSWVLRCIFCFFIFTCISPAWSQFRSTLIPTLHSELEEEEEPSQDKKKKKDKKFSVWGSANQYNFKDDFVLVQTKGTQYTGVIGLDYRLDPSLKVGNYYIRGDTNAHSPLGNAAYKIKSDTLHPYIMYNFTPKFFANLLLGYSYIATHTKRHGLRSALPIFSKSQGALWSISPSLTFFPKYEHLEGSFEFGYGNEAAVVKKLVESNGNVVNDRRVRRKYTYVFADIAYRFKDVGEGVRAIAPYMQGGMDYNFELTPLRSPAGINLDRAREGYTAGAGIRFYLAQDVTLSAGWRRTGGHSGLLTDVYTLFLRVGTL